MTDDTMILRGKTLYDITPERIAELFCAMGSDEQARFFNHIAEIAQTWKAAGLCMQLQWITEDDGLTLAGRRVMQYIGEYSHWGLVPRGSDYK